MFFLEKLAHTLTQQYGNDLSGVSLIFPSQRSATLFMRYLSKVSGTTLWCPETSSVSAFMRKCTHWQVPDRLSLIYELHQAWQEVTGQEEAFGQFYFWGDLLLKDFDEADRWLTDTDNLFHSVKDQKELDEYFGSLSEQELTALRSFWAGIGKTKPGSGISQEQQKFIRLWEALKPVYHNFNERLYTKGWAYEGRIYRSVALSPLPEILHTRKYIFAGFNYLSRAELTLIKKSVSEADAQVYWDLDAWYMQDSRQEAGTFLRQYKKDPILGPGFPETLPDNIKNPGIIQISALSTRTAQCLTAGNIIAELIRDKNVAEEDIALILPADDLLFPLLNALPPEVQKINITMGYPLRHTPWFSLVEYMAELQEAGVNSKNRVEYWYRPVMGLLRHPLLSDETSLSLAEEFQKRNAIRMRRDDFDSLFSIPDPNKQKWALVFEPHAENNFLDKLLDLLRWMDSNRSEDKDHYDINRDFMFQFYTQINRLNDLVKSGAADPGEGGWLPLFRQLLRQVRLPFSGEPLEGIQIMGVLESRNLDYKYVIILSMEEGHFPPAPDSSSFIPFNLRKAFQLPVPAFQEAAYAYYFYRLLHHSQHMYLLYTPVSEGLAGGEKSRFILQVEAEMPHKKIIHQNYSTQALSEIQIPPSFYLHEHPVLLERLLKRFETGISPSALNTYLDCSLKFSYRYLLGIQEPDSISEEIDPAQFGSLLHKAVEDLYAGMRVQDQEKIPVNAARLKVASASIPKVIESAFQSVIFSGGLPRWEGRNLIIRKVLEKYLQGILHADESLGDFTLLQTEQINTAELLVELQLPQGLTQTRVKIYGNIDRVDETETGIRIVDYKTGKDNRVFSGIEEITNRDSGKLNKAVLQTLIYAWLWLENHPEYAQSAMPLSAGLYTMREIFQDTFDFRIFQKRAGGRGSDPVEDIRPLLPELKSRLSFLFQEMTDPNFHYSATEDINTCRFCPYTEICGR